MSEVTFPAFSVEGSGTSKRSAFTQPYALAGRLILIDAADAELRDLLCAHFAAWHIERIEQRNPIEPRVTISVTRDSAPAKPENLEPFSVASGGTCYTDATSYFFSNDGAVVQADASAPRVHIWLTEECLQDRVAMSEVIFNATMAALRRCGLYELHAAGVVAPNGGGVLIIGPSGSSKSTLATHLAAAGWKYLSDDTLLLHESSGNIEARALRRVFALTNDTFDAFDNLQISEATIAPFDPQKMRFEPRTVFPEGFTASCRPTALFFSRVAREVTSTTRALSRTETLAQLLRMCPWACYDKPTARAHLHVLSELARQARGFELSAGRDLFGDPQYASRFLLTAQ